MSYPNNLLKKSANSGFKPQIGTVVETLLPFHAGFGGLENPQAARVFVEQMPECGFALVQRGMQKRIAVGSQYDLAGVSGRDALYTFYIYRCAVDDRESLVLKMHGGDDVLNDMVASFVVFQNRSLAEMVLADIGNALGCIGGFHRFGVLIQLSVYETLAVTNHPYFTAAGAVDGGTAREPLFRMTEDEVCVIVPGCVDGGKGCCDAFTEILAGGIGGKTLNARCGEHHRIPTVFYSRKDASVGFAGAAVDNRQMMGCDDYPVLARLRGLLSDELLFENFHHRVF